MIKVIDNIISQKELFYMYSEIVSSPGWNLVGQSTVEDNTQLMAAPLLKVKDSDSSVHHYPFLLWGQSLVYRLAELLNSKKLIMYKNKKSPTIVRLLLVCLFSSTKLLCNLVRKNYYNQIYLLP